MLLGRRGLIACTSSASDDTMQTFGTQKRWKVVPLVVDKRGSEAVEAIRGEQQICSRARRYFAPKFRLGQGTRQMTFADASGAQPSTNYSTLLQFRR